MKKLIGFSVFARFIAMIFLLAVSLPAGFSRAQSNESGFLNRTVEIEGTVYRYQVYVPHDYDPVDKWPAILFLHGAGERGADGLKQTAVALGHAIRFNPDRWPAITVFPQVPAGLSWPGLSGEIAMAALEQSTMEFNVDESRIYLTGYSIGGQGTWYLGFQHPERFAAIVPVCGFTHNLESRYSGFLPDSTADKFATLAEALANVPIWIFHGDADQAISVEESRQMFAALKAAGADVRYTEFEGVGHNAWTPAYALEELPIWLLDQRKK